MRRLALAFGHVISNKGGMPRTRPTPVFQITRMNSANCSACARKISPPVAVSGARDSSHTPIP
jgi:hypothetical protein